MFRDDHEAARLRIETLEARLQEKEASLTARDAELAEARAELERLRRGEPGFPRRPDGSGRALRVLVLAALAMASTGVALRAASSPCAARRPCPFGAVARPPAAAALLPAPARLVADPPVLLIEPEKSAREGCEASRMGALDESLDEALDEALDESDELGKAPGLRPSGPNPLP